MYGALDISTSGLVAQRTRLNVISANIANARTILNADGEYEPYRRRSAIFASGTPEDDRGHGVHVAEIRIGDGVLTRRYEPHSPHADSDGYVAYPDVNLVTEQMNAMLAQRSYEANVTAAEISKAMMSVALQMLA